MTEREKEAAEEIGLLDLLVVIAVSWVLLVVGIIAAAIGYTFAAVQPTSYRTSALFALPLAEAERLLDTGAVSVAAETSFAMETAEGVSDEEAEATRITLTGRSANAVEVQPTGLVSAYDTAGRALFDGRALRNCSRS